MPRPTADLLCPCRQLPTVMEGDSSWSLMPLALDSPALSVFSEVSRWAQFPLGGRAVGLLRYPLNSVAPLALVISSSLFGLQTPTQRIERERGEREEREKYMRALPRNCWCLSVWFSLCGHLSPAQLPFLLIPASPALPPLSSTTFSLSCHV